MARNPSHRTYERRYKAGLPKPAPAPVKHTTLYDACVAAGLTMGSWQSDMHLLDTPEARALIVSFMGVRALDRKSVKVVPFRSNIDGKAWLEIPFAWAPFWRSRCKA